MDKFVLQKLYAELPSQNLDRPKSYRRSNQNRTSQNLGTKTGTTLTDNGVYNTKAIVEFRKFKCDSLIFVPRRDFWASTDHPPSKFHSFG